eukprot:5102893-Prymnesium_polylepis.1
MAIRRESVVQGNKCSCVLATPAHVALHPSRTFAAGLTITDNDGHRASPRARLNTVRWVLAA